MITSISIAMIVIIIISSIMNMCVCIYIYIYIYLYTYIYIHIHTYIYTLVISVLCCSLVLSKVCVFEASRVSAMHNYCFLPEHNRGPRSRDPSEGLKQESWAGKRRYSQSTLLPRSTLSANSVRLIFPSRDPSGGLVARRRRLPAQRERHRSSWSEGGGGTT